MADVLFISGIDTDAGKSYATGWLAKQLMAQGKHVITQKFIQTGNHVHSEDIAVHRRLMGTGLLPADLDLTTAPIIYTYPASPQLAAEIDGRPIDLTLVDRATERLSQDFDTVLIEGAGGLMVPLSDEFLTIDYPRTRNLPVVLVTNGILGSINHAILSLEALKARGMTLHSVIYNTHFDHRDPRIAADTRAFISRYLGRNHPGVPMLLCPTMPNPGHTALSITKEQLAQFPTAEYSGKISLIDNMPSAINALKWLTHRKRVGFDTETRPSFHRGQPHTVALVQIAAEGRCFLFRVNKLGLFPELIQFFENPEIQKIGLSVRDDINMLRRIATVEPQNVIELQQIVKDYKIIDCSLQKIYGIIFGERISKAQRLTNWESETLTDKQQVYAAIDADACLKIYDHLLSGNFDPDESPYHIPLN